MPSRAELLAIAEWDMSRFKMKPLRSAAELGISERDIAAGWAQYQAEEVAPLEGRLVLFEPRMVCSRRHQTLLLAPLPLHDQYFYRDDYRGAPCYCRGTGQTSNWSGA